MKNKVIISEGRVIAIQDVPKNLTHLRSAGELIFGLFERFISVWIFGLFDMFRSDEYLVHFISEWIFILFDMFKSEWIFGSFHIGENITIWDVQFGVTIQHHSRCLYRSDSDYTWQHLRCPNWNDNLATFEMSKLEWVIDTIWDVQIRVSIWHHLRCLNWSKYFTPFEMSIVRVNIISPVKICSTYRSEYLVHLICPNRSEHLTSFEMSMMLKWIFSEEKGN